MQVHAQEAYPSRPIRIVVGYSAGGGNDLVIRVIAPKLGEALGQPVVVDNKPGAQSIIAAELVAKSAPDGYTLLMGNVSLTISMYAASKPPFDVAQDLEPVGMVVSLPLMLVVNSALPVNSLHDLIEYAKARPGALNYGSVGHGGAHHLSGEMLQSMTGVKMVHIPYKGGGAAIQAVLAQEAQLLFLTPLALMPNVKSGRLRALAVTSAKRTSAAPDVPTMSEAGLTGFEVDNWHTLFAPHGTPREIVGRLNTELNRVLGQADVKQQLLASQGADAWPSTPAEARAHVAAEIEKWGRVVKQTGATVN
jgi:tripartite-type tricarboxylate transporter receptor subunit TctC